MKKLMILGAGVYQLPLIKKAREMGVKTIVVSIAGNYPGFAYADKIVKVDTTDCEQVLAAALIEDIDGIATSGTDVAIKTLGFVADAMQIPGVSYRSARIMTDKAEMKNAFSGIVTTSDYRIVSDMDEALKAAEIIGYPVMLKACDASGSRGITRVDIPEKMHTAFEKSKECSKKDHFIVEKYVKGVEIGVDAVIYNNETVLCLPHKKFIKKTGYTTIPGGHAFPLNVSDEINEKIKTEVSNIARATGINNCMLNCDMFLCDDGNVSVIEAGARAGATCIPELISIYTGIDYYEQIIKNAFNEPMDLEIKANVPCMAKLLFTDYDGIIESIDEEYINSLRTEDVQIAIDYKTGDKVRAVKNGTDRIGHVIMKTDNENEIDDIVAKVVSCIKIVPETN